MQAAAPAKPPYRLLARLGLLVGGLLLGLLGAELLVRVAGQDPLDRSLTPEGAAGWGGGCFQLDEATGYAYRPETCGTNSLGFHGPEPSEQGSRILLLGDSIAAEGIFPVLLERLLQERRALPIQVINTGTPGYGTANEQALYRKHAAVLDPDLVLLQFCPNDYSGTPFLFEHEGEQVVVRDRKGVLLGRSGWWLSRSALYRLAVLGEAPPVRSAAVQDRFPATERALLELRDQLASEGRALVVVLFPYLAERGSWPAIQQEVHRRIRELLAAEGIHTIDLQDDFYRQDISQLLRPGAAPLYDGLPRSVAAWGLPRKLGEMVAELPPYQVKIVRQARGEGDPIHPNFMGHAIAAWRISVYLDQHPELLAR